MCNHEKKKLFLTMKVPIYVGAKTEYLKDCKDQIISLQLKLLSIKIETVTTNQDLVNSYSTITLSTMEPEFNSYELYRLGFLAGRIEPTKK